MEREYGHFGTLSCMEGHLHFTSGSLGQILIFSWKMRFRRRDSREGEAMLRQTNKDEVKEARLTLRVRLATTDSQRMKMRRDSRGG